MSLGINQPRPIHPALPPEAHRRLAGRTFTVTLPRQVTVRMRRAARLGVAEWAASHRVVTDGPHVGPWRHEFAPHTVKIMETFGQPWVREVWFCGVEQSGKTNTMLNCLGWSVDCAPGAVFYLMPTEATAAKVTGEKIRPMLEQSPQLARYVTKSRDDLTMTKLSLSHGMTIRPAWANSPAAMATWSAKYCFGDEVDKYPPMAGKEADPITLIRKRNRTYKGRYKRFFASTPAGMFVYAGVYGDKDKGVVGCEQVWVYHCRCPHCGELIRMDADHLTATDHGAGYACNSCGVVWTEADRERAIRGGDWICIKGAEIKRPATVGFHHRAYECLDVSLAEMSAAWQLAQGGDHAAKVAWANGYEAVDYKQDLSERQEDFILRLVDPSMPRGVCPRSPAAVLLIVDTQARGFYYQVVAHGYGQAGESWRIDHGFVEQFSHLVDIAHRDYLDPDGKVYRAVAGFIDSGGGSDPLRPKHSRTAAVYAFCRKHPFFRPLKGYQTQDQLWTVSRRDFYPSRRGKKVPIPGGLLLYKINVTYYKDALDEKLKIEPGDPGACHFHAEVGADVARQLCAEYRDERGRWQCPRGKDNHHWDIAVYDLAAVDILGIKDRRPGTRTKKRRILSKGVSIDD